MEKIDRLGWAAGVSFAAFRVRMGIRVNDAVVMPQVLPRLPPGWKAARTPEVEELYSLIVGQAQLENGLRHYHLLYAGAARRARTMDLDELLDVLESELHFQVA